MHARRRLIECVYQRGESDGYLRASIVLKLKVTRREALT